MSTSASLAVSRMIGTGLCARTSRQMSRPLLPGIMMSRISRSKAVVVDLPLGLLAIRREGDVESLLLERVADGFTDRKLVVDDEDAAHGGAGRGLMRPASGSAWAARSRTQKVLPSPGSERSPISPFITSTIRFAIERPSPNPSPSSVADTPVEALEDALLLVRGGFPCRCPGTSIVTVFSVPAVPREG